MTKASLKARYEPSAQAASATLSVGFGELKLKASCTDRTFEDGLSLAGVSLGVERPGLFMIDYDLPQQAARFQFMNAAKVYGKQLKLTYIHPQKANATLVESTLSFDPANKLTGKYSFHSGKGSLKYSYVHSSGVTLEPSYDFHSESWSFAAFQKFADQNTLKASYETSKKLVGLEWTRESKETGFFKVTCNFNANENKAPRLSLEKTWNLEI
ncbi:hypothetical protein L7F22_028037 [Adiantum nelumboides]|nr:hypothetical protein [Adiantum nelumboides]